jgi:hypothetical protein
VTVPLTPPSASAWEAPPPVLLNTWKRHAGTLRWRTRTAAAAGPGALDELARNLVVIGTALMDLYLGDLPPYALGEGVRALLRRDDRLPLAAYRAWVEAGGGYRTVTLPEDGSQWVLRLGDEADRYVHVHPARGVPKTCRVNANVFKTAVLALAYPGVHGGDPLDVALVNRVRREYLGLAPLGRDLARDQGIGQAIQRLRGTDGGRGVARRSGTPGSVRPKRATPSKGHRPWRTSRSGLVWAKRLAMSDV